MSPVIVSPRSGSEQNSSPDGVTSSCLWVTASVISAHAQKVVINADIMIRNQIQQLKG